MRNLLSDNGFVWFIGVVEDRNDPSQLGRFRVRCFGFHTDDKSQIPTDELPWAIPLQDVTSAAINGIGRSPTGLVEGSWVVGFFLDGERAQEPVVLGSIASAPSEFPNKQRGFYDPNEVYPKFINESDVNRRSRGIKNITKTPDSVISEPPDPYDAAYPKNHVYESESGHLLEFDDTPNKERIHVYHKSGTFVEIHPNGDVVTQHKNGWRSVTGNDKLHVTGNMDIVVDGNVTWTVKGNVTEKITGNLDVDAARIDLN